jgi:hypothetical protein
VAAAEGVGHQDGHILALQLGLLVAKQLQRHLARSVGRGIKFRKKGVVVKV